MNEIDEKLSKAVGLLFEGQFKDAQHNCSEVIIRINNPLDQRLIAAQVVICLCYIYQENIDLAEDYYFESQLASRIQLINDARNFQFATQLQSELKCYNDLLQTYINKILSFVDKGDIQEALYGVANFWHDEQEEAQDAFNLLLKKYPSSEEQILIYGVRACCYAKHEEHRKEALQDIGAVLLLDKQLSQRGLENAELFWISDVAPMLRDVARLPIFNYNNTEQVLS